MKHTDAEKKQLLIDQANKEAEARWELMGKQKKTQVECAKAQEMVAGAWYAITR